MTEGWTITIEAVAEEPVQEDALLAFHDLLADRGGATNFAGRRYGATFSLEPHDLASDDIGEACRAGAEIFARLAMKVGIPESQLVRLEALTWSEADAELTKPLIPELVGITEIAKRLGITRQRASALQTREGFPRPVAVLASGPVWPVPWLERFIGDWDRKPGRPRKPQPAASGR
jgi:hypothetical protein